MDELIKLLKTKGVLKSDSITSALWNVDRADFVRKEEKIFAYDDVPLPIGHGQTISQPYTVVFMLELLEVKKGQIVLDAGFGSGWQSALLSHIVGEEGKVFAFEIVKELCSFGKNNLKKYPRLEKNISFFCESAKEGVPGIPDRSLDRIIAAARMREVPEVWKKQLKEGGIMVYPLKESIFKEKKKTEGIFEKQEFPGFVFVPFV